MVVDYSAIAETEKSDIKNLLLTECFKEPVPQIAIQIAVLIGNISRLDYPNDWIEVSEIYKIAVTDEENVIIIVFFVLYLCPCLMSFRIMFHNSI